MQYYLLPAAWTLWMAFLLLAPIDEELELEDASELLLLLLLEGGLAAAPPLSLVIIEGGPPKRTPNWFVIDDTKFWISSGVAPAWDAEGLNKIYIFY